MAEPLKIRSMRWLRNLFLASLAGTAPYLCVIGFCVLTGSDEFAWVWFSVSICFGIVAGVLCRLWSPPGAALVAAAVYALVTIFGDTHGDSGIVVFLGTLALFAYAAGLLVGIPSGYLLRMILASRRRR